MDNNIYTAIENGIMDVKVKIAQNPTFEKVITSEMVTKIMNDDYINMLSKLKPINLITELYHIIKARSVKSAVAHTLKILESYELLYTWKLSDFADMINPCVEVILNLFKRCGDFVDMITNAFINQGDALLQSNNEDDAETYYDTEEMNCDMFSLDIKDDGIAAKCVSFLTQCLVKANASEKEIEETKNLVLKMAPLAALVMTGSIALVLLFCGPQLQKTLFGTGTVYLAHSLAGELKDWNIIFGSLKNVWKYVTDGIGTFLGFTFNDELTLRREELIKKVCDFSNEVIEYKKKLKLDFPSFSRRPGFLKEIGAKKDELDKLVDELSRASKDKLDLNGLRLSLTNLKENVKSLDSLYNSIVTALVGKQLPATVFIGGPPGCGKSTAFIHIEKELERLSGRTLPVYTRNPLDQYISKYGKQPIFKYDDFNQDKKETDIMELCGIYTPAAYFINGPFEDTKGETFESTYLFMASNNIFPRAMEVNCPEMTNRRTDWRFFAYTEFEPAPGATQSYPTSKEEALKHLVLYERHVDDPENYNIFSAYTIDGRNVPIIDLKVNMAKQKHKGNVIEIPSYTDYLNKIKQKKQTDGVNYMTSFKLDDLALKIFELEKKRAEIYIKETKEKLQQANLIVEEVMEPNAHGLKKAIKIVESSRKKSVLLLGDAGVGKTELARQYRTNKNRVNEIEDDPFVSEMNVERHKKAHEKINTAYDQALDETIIITSQKESWLRYLNTLQAEDRAALERRMVKYEFSFKHKGLILIGGKYNHIDMEQDYKNNNGANRNKFVKIVRFDGKVIPFETLEEELQAHSEITNNVSHVHDDVLHVPVDMDIMKNVIRIKLGFNDADTLQTHHIEVIRTEQNVVWLAAKMMPVFQQVRQKFVVSEGLEQGLKQLNNLRISSPVNYPIVVKFDDVCLLLVPDNENHLYFAIVDNDFEYVIENDEVICKYQGEFLWKESQVIQQWYKFVLTKIPVPQIGVVEVTPVASNFKKWTDHFVNFLKTTTAVAATIGICNEIADDAMARESNVELENDIGYEDFIKNNQIKRNYKTEGPVMLDDMSKQEFYQREADKKKKQREGKRNEFRYIHNTMQDDMSKQEYYQREENKKKKQREARKTEFRYVHNQMQEDMTKQEYYQREETKKRKQRESQKSSWKYCQNQMESDIRMTNDTQLDPQADMQSSIISKNVGEVGVIGADGKFCKLVFAIGIKKKLFVTVSHVYDSYQEKLVLRFKGTIHKIWCWKMCASDVDKMFFYVPSLRCEVKDISENIPQSGVQKSYEGFPLIMTKPEFSNGMYEGNSKYVVMMKKEVVQKTRLGPRSGMYYTNQGMYSSMLVGQGDCGTPAILIDSTRRHKFIGFHIASHTRAGLITFLYRDDFDDYDEGKLNEMMGNDAVESSYGKKEIVLPFQQVVLKEEIEQLIEKGGNKEEILDLCKINPELSPLFDFVGIAGKIQGKKIIPNVSQSTSLTQMYYSPFGNEEERNIFSPAAFSEQDSRVKVEGSIYYRAVNIYGQVRPNLSEEDKELLLECAEHTGHQYANVIARNNGQASLFTISEAINGSPKYETSKALPRDTSVAYPQKFLPCFQQNGGVKNTALEFIESKQMWKIAENEAGKNLIDCMQSFKLAMKKGQKTCVIWSSSLKDEPIKMEKVEMGITRAFWGSPFYYSVVHRQYFGAAAALEAINFHELPSKVGINACSREWNGLYNYLTRVGEYGFDLDYKNWDGKVLKEEMEVIPIIDNIIYQRCDPNWKEEDDQMRINIYQHLIEPNLLVDHLIFKSHGGQMSGQPRTALDNCRINLNRVKFAWIKLARIYQPHLANFLSFEENVSVAIYGDDIVVMVDESCHSWFTPTKYAELFKKWNVVITSADKSSELKMRHISEMSFLKRSFRKDHNGNVIGALEDKSFVKMMNFCKRTKRHLFKIEEDIHFDFGTIALSARSILDEASLKGKEFYEKTLRHILQRADEWNITIPEISTWKDTFNRVYFGNVVPCINGDDIPIQKGHPLHLKTEQQLILFDKKFFSIEHYYYYELIRRYAQQHGAGVVQIPTIQALKQYVHNLHIEDITSNPNITDKVMKKVILVILNSLNFTLDVTNNYILVDGDRYWGCGSSDPMCSKGQNMFGVLLKQALFERRFLDSESSPLNPK